MGRLFTCQRRRDRSGSGGIKHEARLPSLGRFPCDASCNEVRRVIGPHLSFPGMRRRGNHCNTGAAFQQSSELPAPLLEHALHRGGRQARRNIKLPSCLKATMVDPCGIQGGSGLWETIHFSQGGWMDECQKKREGKGTPQERWKGGWSNNARCEKGPSTKRNSERRTTQTTLKGRNCFEAAARKERRRRSCSTCQVERKVEGNSEATDWRAGWCSWCTYHRGRGRRGFEWCVRVRKLHLLTFRSPGHRRRVEQAEDLKRDESETSRRWGPLSPRSGRKAVGAKRKYYERFERTVDQEGGSHDGTSSEGTIEEKEEDGASRWTEGSGRIGSTVGWTRPSGQVREGSGEEKEKEEKEKEETEETDSEGWDDSVILRFFEQLRGVGGSSRGGELLVRYGSSSTQESEIEPGVGFGDASGSRPRTIGPRSSHECGPSAERSHWRSEDPYILQPTCEDGVPSPLEGASGDAPHCGDIRSAQEWKDCFGGRLLVSEVHGDSPVDGRHELADGEAHGVVSSGRSFSCRASCYLSDTAACKAGVENAGREYLLEPKRWQRPRRERQRILRLLRGQGRKQGRRKRPRKRKERKGKIPESELVRQRSARLGQEQGKAGRETKELELAYALIPVVEHHDVNESNTTSLAKAVENKPKLGFYQLFSGETTLASLGGILAWALVQSGMRPEGALEARVIQCFYDSGAWQRMGRRRPVLPIREGRLAGIREKLAGTDLDTVKLLCLELDFSIKCWMMLCFYSCNSLLGQQQPLLQGNWSQAEDRAASAVQRSVEKFLRLESAKDVSLLEMEKDVKLTRISYTGEEVKSCHKLTTEQILPALPPKEHGGCIDLLDYVSPITKEFLLHPENCIKKDDGRDMPKLQGKVHVEHGEIDTIAGLLVERGICKWVELSTVHRYRGQTVLNGLFGVPKPSTVASGKPVLRLIMNLVASNATMLQYEGAVSNLPAITSWMSTVMDQNEEIRFWQLDMSNAFYLFRLPDCWCPFLSFNLIRSGDVLGFDPNKKYALACRVLPMGWLSSVSIMQEVSECLVNPTVLPREEQVSKSKTLPLWMTGLLKEVRKGRKAWWHVYLDNFAAGQLIDLDEVPAEGDRLQDLTEEAWLRARVMNSEKKRKRATLEVEELGAFVSGTSGLLGASGPRLHKTVIATIWLLSQAHLSKKNLQVVAGRWVHILQFRRAGMSFLEHVWEFIGTKRFNGFLVEKARRELLALACAIPLLHTDLCTPMDSVITASDASMAGGAVGIARQLTAEGADWVRASLIGLPPNMKIPVMVISLFNGIGGCFRCYDVLGLIPEVLISYEIFSPANRIVSRRWPHAELCGDVAELTDDKVKELFRKHTGITEIHLWAGFPCTDLTGIKWGRQNLSGMKSKLFYEVPRILQVLRRNKPEFVHLRFGGENVASMDKSACAEITRTMGVKPFHLNCSDAVPMNRPRLCWCSEDLRGAVDGLEFQDDDHWCWVTAANVYPRMTDWMEEEVQWPGGEMGEVLPTALRAIIRNKPPPRPAGIHRCNQDVLARWESESFKFPPYHYLDRFIFWKGEKWRLCDADERELLLGYGWKHTSLSRAASKIKGAESQYENERLSLLGDSFSVYSFVIVAAALCKEFMPRIHYSHLCDRMGLSPGISAPWRLKAPLKRKLQYGYGTSETLATVEMLNRILLSRTNHTGSDVRISTGHVMNAKAFPRQSIEAGWWTWEPCFKFKWNSKEHINVFELRAILQTILFRIRHHRLTDARVTHITDSYVCMSIIGKGRSSSRFLNQTLKILNAYLLMHGLYLIIAHVESSQNPTDHDSRTV